ncbi:heavy-metal-associated domain-containing protein [Pararhizobium sp. PWRC1-1]
MYEFHIPTMTCGGCKSAVEQALKSVDAARSRAIDLTLR